MVENMTWVRLWLTGLAAITIRYFPILGIYSRIPKKRNLLTP
ncbi:hypothetical protein VRRI112168_00785 [Vreelandella rituensis]